jgi:rhodanese-related sulfurtransferase
MQTITVQKLHEQFANFLVIDVREQWEWDISHIEGAILLPLKDLPNKFSELDQTCNLAVLCHHGARSARAVAFLLQQGYTNVYNVNGGIDAWSRGVDPSVPLY